MNKFGGVFGIAVLVIVAAALGDILAHSAGTKAAFGGLSSLWTPSLQAASGQAIK